MKPTKMLQLLLISLFVPGIAFSQVVTDENWLRSISGAYCRGYVDLQYSYKTFTKDDVLKAKEKLNTISRSSPKSEWEGLYSLGTIIGDDRLIWDSGAGFLRFYCYHEVEILNYGKARNSLNSVEFLSEKPSALAARKKRPDEAEMKLIKVLYGERHYLIPENRLRDFCERVAGLSTDVQDFFYYWYKKEDTEKKVFGFPVLPKEYRHLLRSPIEARIVSIGRRKIIPNEQSTKKYNFDDIHYPVTLSAGRNKKVKKQMNFFAEELGEWIEITKVFQTKSIGFIRRNFGENGREQCRDAEGGGGQLIACKKIKTGMKSVTKISEMYF